MIGCVSHAGIADWLKYLGYDLVRCMARSTSCLDNKKKSIKSHACAVLGEHYTSTRCSDKTICGNTSGLTSIFVVRRKSGPALCYARNATTSLESGS